MELIKKNTSLAEVLLERTVHMIFERDFMNACRSLFHEFDQARPSPAATRALRVNDAARLLTQRLLTGQRPYSSLLSFCRMDRDNSR